MTVVAALLERRAALMALRRALPGRPARVLAARSPDHLSRLLHEHLIDIVVIGPHAARGAAFDALRHEFASLPVVVLAPIRSEDAGLVRRVERGGGAGVLIEGIDDPILAPQLRRRGLAARREDALLPLATALDLVDPLQQRAWRMIVAEAPGRLGTAGLARRLGVSRETLSRRFGAGRAPALKAAIDGVRLVAAGQLLGSRAYRVRDVARLLGFSSAALLQRTARRLAGAPARAIGSLPADRILAALLAGRGSRWG